MPLDKESIDQITNLLKQEIGNQTTIMETKLNTITQAHKESTEQITQTITGLKHTITQNTEGISQNTNRMDQMEQGFTTELESIHKKIKEIEQGTTSTEEHMENITQAGTIKHEISEKTDITKADITRAARKIIGVAPITDLDFQRLYTPDMTLDDLYSCTTVEFLKLELKYTHEECENLDIRRITRPRSENTDKLFLHFATEKSADYLQ